MDQSALSHLMTNAEREHFESEGFLFVENALSDQETASLLSRVDEAHDAAVKAGATKPSDS